MRIALIICASLLAIFIVQAETSVGQCTVVGESCGKGPVACTCGERLTIPGISARRNDLSEGGQTCTLCCTVPTDCPGSYFAGAPYGTWIYPTDYVCDRYDSVTQIIYPHDPPDCYAIGTDWSGTFDEVDFTCSLGDCILNAAITVAGTFSFRTCPDCPNP